MYTKQEKAKQKQLFWTAFGQYMRPVLNADGEKVNWVNYKTGIPGIYFRMDADEQRATIAIELTHTDTTLRHDQYQRLLQLMTVLHETLGEEWQWQQDTVDEYGKQLSKVGTQLAGINIHRNDDWPHIISFLKQRIMALDEFWSMVKVGFE